MFYIIFTYPILSGNGLILGIQMAGVFLGMWAVLKMSKSRFNITPVPLEDSHFVIGGPYRFIRHPMYLALLLFLTPLIFIFPDTTGTIIFIVFLVNLIMKLSYEEKLLLEKFERYRDYRRHTWRLIPYIF
jgi:protein-S-isoprenylcysteine O-methyltransferase Ste14